MKCQNCGSEHGFRGEQSTIHRKRPDGLMEMVADGPERIICKKCGEQVTLESVMGTTPEGIEVMSGVPPHLENEFFADDEDNKTLGDGDK